MVVAAEKKAALPRSRPSHDLRGLRRDMQTCFSLVFLQDFRIIVVTVAFSTQKLHTYVNNLTRPGTDRRNPVVDFKNSLLF